MSDPEHQPAGPPGTPAFAWVHVGPPEGTQAAMLRLSLLSAQLFHPEVPKICVVPRGAADLLRRRLADLTDSHGCEAAVHEVDVPEEDDREVSRWLKIGASRILGRDVLCVDSDTLFVQRLDFRDVPTAALAATVNQDGIHGRRVSSAPWVGELFGACGWEWEASWGDRYRNTGVIWYRAGREAERFAERWLANWRHFRRQTGKHYDQPAFNRTAFETGLVATLPASWNAPVGVLPQTARDARIFHYFSSMGSVPAHTLWGRLMARDRAGRLPAPGVLRAWLETRRPYVGLGGYPREYWLAGQWGYYPAAWLQWKLRGARARVAAAFRARPAD